MIEAKHVKKIFHGYPFNAYSFSRLFKNAIKLTNRYGINFKVIDNEEKACRLIENSNHIIKHFIVRSKLKFASEHIVKLVKLLELNNSSLSVAYSYKDVYESSLYCEDIENIKKKFGDRLNIMRPDEIKNNLYLVSNLKLLDNIICDTIRLKYSVNNISSSSVWPDLPSKIKMFFQESAYLYETHQMYHRSSSDGYFAHRSQNGFFITSTKTCKTTKMDRDRISEVLDYNEIKNVISYRGKYLPSSDAVEAAILFNTHPDIMNIIHTHDSYRFTRNQQIIKKYKAVDFLPYGEKELGYALSKEVLNGYKFIIMKEHGEIFLGDINSSACNLVKEMIHKHLEQEQEQEQEQV